MLPIGPGAPRFSPSQDIHLKNDFRALSVIYITDITFSQAHNPNWASSAGTDELRENAWPRPHRVFKTKSSSSMGWEEFSCKQTASRPSMSQRFSPAKGDFFGEGCLTGQPRRLAAVATMTESLIMRLDKAAIVRVLHDEPKFSEVFMSYLLARNARIEEDLVDQLFNSSEKRLARLLLLMANFGKEAKPEPVIAKISQETLAEMVGTTRSRVSRFMNKFRKLGFIDYNGHLEVHNSLLNVVLHDTPEIRRGADSGE